MLRLLKESVSPSPCIDDRVLNAGDVVCLIAYGVGMDAVVLSLSLLSSNLRRSISSSSLAMKPVLGLNGDPHGRHGGPQLIDNVIIGKITVIILLTPRLMISSSIPVSDMILAYLVDVCSGFNRDGHIEIAPTIIYGEP
jgi:hypothetical protein